MRAQKTQSPAKQSDTRTTPPHLIIQAAHVKRGAELLATPFTPPQNVTYARRTP